MATAESNRAIPAYQAGPFDQLGRGQRMMEDPSPSALPRAHPASNGRRPPGRFTIQKSRERSSRSPGHLSVPPFAFGATPARLSGSLSTRKTENSNPRPFRTPTGFQPAPVASQVHLPRRAEKSNPTVLPAHPLATEPGTPVRFTFPECRTADSNRDPPRSERGASTKVGLVRHAPQRACSGNRTPTASVPRRRAYRCH